MIRALLVPALFISSLLACADEGQAPSYATIEKANFIYAHLTGKMLSRRNPNYQKYIDLISQGKADAVATLITEEPAFIGATVRQWASLTLSFGKKPNIELNDALAMMMGSVRDNRDARELLTGNFTYGASSKIGLGKPNPQSVDYFLKLETAPKELKDKLQYYTPQWEETSFKDPAGLMTTRFWGEQYYSGGTNRRAMVGAFETFLCEPKEFWKTSFLPTHRIRQDIPRDSGGDVRTFQRDCRTCHSGMDALSGAFARYDFTDGRLLYTADAIRPKYFNSNHIYPEGFVTTDDSFINYLTGLQNEVFGWRGKLTGNGVNQFGQMIAESHGFSKCFSKRIYEQVCGGTLELTDPLTDELANRFEESAYKLKDQFIFTVLHPQCSKNGE